MKTEKHPKKWDFETDVLVVGTGGAGLTAAIVAHDQGANTMIIEKSDKVGGTTAVSGGVIWVPINHYMEKAGIKDSQAEAMTYIKKLAEDRVDDSIIESLIDNGPKMVKYIEEKTPLKFKLIKDYPDYHPDWEGGKPKGGRSLESGLFDTNELGEWKDKLRKSPIFGFTPITFEEAMKWKVFSNPKDMDMELVSERLQKGKVGYGEALIGKLLSACLKRGVEPILKTAAKQLITDDENRVIGLRAEHLGESIFIKVSRGVIMASGGYEWNEAMVKQFLPGPPMGISTCPPHNEGEAISMSMEIGANLANMSEAWWFPGLQVPNEEYDGKPLMRLCLAERSLPHTIIVNKYGKRFVNEAHNYHDVGKTFNVYDPVKGEYPNVPAWLILDSKFFRKYLFVTSMPGDTPPNWVKRGNTLRELAEIIGVEPDGFKETVNQFNQYAIKGEDPDFHRGGNTYDRFQGDPDHQPNPNLGKIEKGPYYAIQMHKSNLGTKGGPKIDVKGRVLNVHDEVIHGLYAVGNAAMGVTGPGYGGPGGTIGPAMTYAYLAAMDAAMQKSDHKDEKIESYA
ncbi:MAG: FAD-dependent oxidoreductase [Bacteroidota bacterium]